MKLPHPFLLASAIMLLLLWGQAPASAADRFLQVDLGVGAVAYTEQVEVEDVDSSWAAGMLELNLSAGMRHPGWLLQTRLGLWGSSEEDEDWESGNYILQRNELSVQGSELLLEAGPSFPLRQGDGGFDLLLGVGLRRQTFERGSFSFMGDREQALVVDETYDMAYVNGAVAFQQSLGAQTQVSGRGELGLILFSEADNSAFGTKIEGQGGTIFRGEVALEQRLAANRSLVLSLLADLQSIEGDQIRVVGPGGTRGVVEWPDNDLFRITGRLGYLVRF